MVNTASRCLVTDDEQCHEPGKGSRKELKQMTNSLFDNYSKVIEHIPYAKKSELVGQLFTIVDYKLVKDKEQYGGDFQDTYVLTINIDEHGKYLLDFAWGSKEEPNRNFAMLAAADAAQWKPTEDDIFTIEKNTFQAKSGTTITTFNLAPAE